MWLWLSWPPLYKINTCKLFEKKQLCYNFEYFRKLYLLDAYARYFSHRTILTQLLLSYNLLRGSMRFKARLSIHYWDIQNRYRNILFPFCNVKLWVFGKLKCLTFFFYLFTSTIILVDSKFSIPTCTGESLNMMQKSAFFSPKTDILCSTVRNLFNFCDQKSVERNEFLNWILLQVT